MPPRGRQSVGPRRTCWGSDSDLNPDLACPGIDRQDTGHYQAAAQAVGLPVACRDVNGEISSRVSSGFLQTDTMESCRQYGLRWNSGRCDSAIGQVHRLGRLEIGLGGECES